MIKLENTKFKQNGVYWLMMKKKTVNICPSNNIVNLEYL
jgi:hypothetical protein